MTRMFRTTKPAEEHVHEKMEQDSILWLASAIGVQFEWAVRYYCL